MGQFDETARQAAKEEAHSFIDWVLSHDTQPSPWRFDRWDDARRIPLPGGPDRTDDLVAVLRRTEGPDVLPVFQIVEIEAEPNTLIFPRLGVYGWLLVAEMLAVSGTAPHVGVAVLQLMGEVPREGLLCVVPETSMRLGVHPLVINLKDDDAAATLTAIEAGRFGQCILPWVALMKGGGDPALIEEWKRIAMTEPDVGKRVVYRDRALVFAELARRLVNWQNALRGWQMRESQVIKGWMDEGKQIGVVETQRAFLLETLRARFQDPLSETVRVAIDGTNDPATLERWFKAALRANTLAEFRAAMPLDN